MTVTSALNIFYKRAHNTVLLEVPSEDYYWYIAFPDDDWSRYYNYCAEDYATYCKDRLLVAACCLLPHAL